MITFLLPRYRRVMKIGAGSFANVFLAVTVNNVAHISGERKLVAVKQIRSSKTSRVLAETEAK